MRRPFCGVEAKVRAEDADILGATMRDVRGEGSARRAIEAGSCILCAIVGW